MSRTKIETLIEDFGDLGATKERIDYWTEHHGFPKPVKVLADDLRYYDYGPIWHWFRLNRKAPPPGMVVPRRWQRDCKHFEQEQEAKRRKAIKRLNEKWDRWIYGEQKTE